MYRLATKCTTKTTYKPASQNTVISFLLYSAASRHSAVRCDRRPVPSADCMCCRGVRTANLRTQIRSNC